ncbi:MAG: hypothetical protein SOZ58_00200 [Prevotella sp.]|nr:hypothetical protein [Prevotella sp.]
MKKQVSSIGWAYTLLSMMLIGFALTLIGCKAQSNVSEKVRTEYLTKEVHQGDVIGTDRWHSKDTSKELSRSKEKVDSTAYYRSIIDSMRRIKQDSTYITKTIEKELSLWDRTKIKFGGVAFAIVAATIIYLTWYIKRKDRQNI